MQHVPRCGERQSDGTEYKKTLRRPGLCPGPRWGSLQRSRKPPSWWGSAGCPSPKTSSPALGPLGLASPTPTPKLVPTPLTAKNIITSCYFHLMAGVSRLDTNITSQRKRCAHTKNADYTLEYIAKLYKNTSILTQSVYPYIRHTKLKERSTYCVLIRHRIEKAMVHY